MRYRESTYHTMPDAMSFIDSLEDIDSATHAIWYCLHQVVWHKGVDRVRWILENKELIREIAHCGDSIFFLENKSLRNRFWDSVYELKDLDR